LVGIAASVARSNVKVITIAGAEPAEACTPSYTKDYLMLKPHIIAAEGLANHLVALAWANCWMEGGYGSLLAARG